MDRQGVSPLVALVLYLAIAIGTVGLVWNVTGPMVDRMEDTGTIQAQIDFLQQLDGTIQEVASHGVGNTRVLTHSFSSGAYSINTSNSTIAYRLRTDSPIIGSNTSVQRGDVTLRAEPATAAPGSGNRTVAALLRYPDFHLAGRSVDMGRGSYRFVVRNNGQANGLPNISVRLQ